MILFLMCVLCFTNVHATDQGKVFIEQGTFVHFNDTNSRDSGDVAAENELDHIAVVGPHISIKTTTNKKRGGGWCDCTPPPPGGNAVLSNPTIAVIVAIMNFAGVGLQFWVSDYLGKTIPGCGDVSITTFSGVGQFLSGLPTLFSTPVSQIMPKMNKFSQIVYFLGGSTNFCINLFLTVAIVEVGGALTTMMCAFTMPLCMIFSYIFSLRKYKTGHITGCIIASVGAAGSAYPAVALSETLTLSTKGLVGLVMSTVALAWAPINQELLGCLQRNPETLLCIPGTDVDGAVYGMVTGFYFLGECIAAVIAAQASGYENPIGDFHSILLGGGVAGPLLATGLIASQGIYTISYTCMTGCFGAAVSEFCNLLSAMIPWFLEWMEQVWKGEERQGVLYECLGQFVVLVGGTIFIWGR